MYSGNNSSALRSRKWLHKALLQLLEEKNIHRSPLRKSVKKQICHGRLFIKYSILKKRSLSGLQHCLYVRNPYSDPDSLVPPVFSSRPISCGWNNRSSITFRSSAISGLNSIFPSISFSRSAPGATSTRRRPCSVKRKTARSVI